MKTQITKATSNAAGGQMARAGDRVSSFGQMIERRKGELAKALDGRLNPDLLMRFMLTELRKTPKLAECNDRSLLGCLMQSAQLGLLPGGALGLMYFIPYGAEATPIIGYKGLRELALRSGFVDDIQAQVVYEKDSFDFAYGDTPHLTHKPSSDDNPGAIVAFYAIAWLKNGRKPFEVMRKRDVDAIRARSRAGQNGPWVTDYVEMGRKTVIRRLVKSLPTSIFPPEAHEELDREDERDYRAPSGRPAPQEELFADAMDAEFENEAEAEASPPAPPATPAASLDEYRAEIVVLHSALIEATDDMSAGDAAFADAGLEVGNIGECNDLSKLVQVKNALKAAMLKGKK